MTNTSCVPNLIKHGCQIFTCQENSVIFSTTGDSAIL